MATTNKELETRRTIRPVCNIWEENGTVQLQLEMPGVTKGDIDLRVDNDHLIIRGRRPQPEENATYVIRERSWGDFSQSYTIDDTIDRERIDAKMDRGVLTVSLHLKEAVKPRRIEVKAR